MVYSGKYDISLHAHQSKIIKKRPRLRNIKVHWLCCQNKWAKPAEREGDLTGMEIWSCSCIGVFSGVYTKSSITGVFCIMSGLPLRPIKVCWKRIHWQTGSKLYFLCLSVIEKFAKTWSALTVFFRVTEKRDLLKNTDLVPRPSYNKAFCKESFTKYS